MNDEIAYNTRKTLTFYAKYSKIMLTEYRFMEDDNAVLWYSSKPPRYNIHFWNMIDEWIVIGFEG